MEIFFWSFKINPLKDKFVENKNAIIYFVVCWAAVSCWVGSPKWTRIIIAKVTEWSHNNTSSQAWSGLLQLEFQSIPNTIRMARMIGIR